MAPFRALFSDKKVTFRSSIYLFFVCFNFNLVRFNIETGKQGDGMRGSGENLFHVRDKFNDSESEALNELSPL